MWWGRACRGGPRSPSLPPAASSSCCPSNCSSPGPGTSRRDPGHLRDSLLLPALSLPPGSPREQSGLDTALYAAHTAIDFRVTSDPQLGTRGPALPRSPHTSLLCPACGGLCPMRPCLTHVCSTSTKLTVSGPAAVQPVYVVRSRKIIKRQFSSTFLQGLLFFTYHRQITDDTNTVTQQAVGRDLFTCFTRSLWEGQL